MEAKEDNQCKLSSQLHKREIKEITGQDMKTDSDSYGNKDCLVSETS